MILWILIFSPWVALVLLVLHDATQGQRRGKIAAHSASPSSEPPRQDTPPPSEQPLVAPPRKKLPWRRGTGDAGRVSATFSELESAITEAVRKTAPQCEAFVGVAVQQTTPKSRLDVNWRLRGVKFGTADKKLANEALTTIVEDMQRRFYLAGH